MSHLKARRKAELCHDALDYVILFRICVPRAGSFFCSLADIDCEMNTLPTNPPPLPHAGDVGKRHQILVAKRVPPDIMGEGWCGNGSLLFRRLYDVICRYM